MPLDELLIRMGRTLDYDAAHAELEKQFLLAQTEDSNSDFDDQGSVTHITQTLIKSSTQAFREALIGCCVARILDETIDIRLPYMNQGENAFNGRTLDEKVINPFLREKEIPCSKAPYLSSLRRNIRLVPETATGLRDKKAFAAMLEFVEHVRGASTLDAQAMLRTLLRGFISLRDAASVRLVQVNRLSLDQHIDLARALLATPSGGLFPVLLCVAALQSLNERFQLGWSIDWQGINVSDAASGVGGDVTVRRKGSVLLSIEITERPIDGARVRATFVTKIAPTAQDDYIFLHGAAAPTDDARDAARAYFAQGHDISLIDLVAWLVPLLGSIGPQGRAAFTRNIVELLASPDIRTDVKVAWNEQVREIITP